MHVWNRNTFVELNFRQDEALDLVSVHCCVSTFDPIPNSSEFCQNIFLCLHFDEKMSKNCFLIFNIAKNGTGIERNKGARKFGILHSQPEVTNTMEHMQRRKGNKQANIKGNWFNRRWINWNWRCAKIQHNRWPKDLQTRRVKEKSQTKGPCTHSVETEGG